MENNSVQHRGSAYSALACQYLRNSSTLFLKAISKYNSGVYGELEYSFTDFHKAWDALWIADNLSGKNGFFTKGEMKAAGLDVKGEDGFIVSITDLLNQLKMRNDREFSGEGKKCCFGYCVQEPNLTRDQKRAPSRVSIGGEIYPKYDENGRRTFLMHNHVKSFNSQESSLIFQELCDYDSGLFYNLFLLKTFRNAAEHDFMELSKGSYAAFINITNPYVMATILNYIEGYAQVLAKVQEDCKNHVKKRKSGYCAYNELSTTQSLHVLARVPLTIASIKSNTILSASFSHVSKMENNVKTIRKLVKESVDDNHDFLNGREMKNPQFYKINLMSEKENLVNPDDYPFSSLQKVSDEIMRQGLTPISRHVLQKHLEVIVAEVPDNVAEYVYIFWGNQRYSNRFLQYVTTQGH